MNLLKLMSYNIHSGKDLQMRDSFSKILALIKEYSPDILALQEINENKTRGYQITQIYNLLNQNFHFGAHVKINNGQYGIATFSPFPIIKKQHIILPSIKEKRGLIHTTLEIDNKEVNILNTHLGLNYQEREQQFAIIEKYIKQMGASFVLMGDFNTTNPILNPSLFHDTSSWNQQNNVPTLIETNQRIDYILTSTNISALKYQVLSICFSDHYPIIAEIKIH